MHLAHWYDCLPYFQRRLKLLRGDGCLALQHVGLPVPDLGAGTV